jgi:threonine dehydrogenase-like Zn-dependent dehydrogenase
VDQVLKKENSMKAAFLESSRVFVVREVPTPTPGPEEVLIRVRACGVCTSEVGCWKVDTPQPVYPGFPDVLNVLDWNYSLRMGTPDYPALWGHELSGVIAEVGGNVRNLEQGMHVTGLGSAGFAEYCIMPACYIVPLHIDFPLTHAITQPMACAYNAVQRACIGPEDRVVILGCGFMGLVVLQMVRLASPLAIVAIDIRDDVLTIAHELGANTVVNLLTGDIQGRLHGLLGPQGASVVFETTGVQEALDLAGRIASVRGRMIIVGYHQGGPRIIDMQTWNYKGIDVVNGHQRDPKDYFIGVQSVVHLLEENKLNLAPLITHTYPLEEINIAYRDVVEKPPGFVKAVIIP